jgi:hypothetical protein
VRYDGEQVGSREDRGRRDESNAARQDGTSAIVAAHASVG